MTLAENINTLEKDKFVAYRGKTVVQTTSPVGNTFKAKRTTVGVTATQIVMPDKAGKFYIKHNSSGVVIYIGSHADITTTSDDVWPLAANEILEVELKAEDANEIYGIVSTSTAYIYAAGVCKE